MLYTIQKIWALSASEVDYTPAKAVQIVDDYASVSSSLFEKGRFEIPITEGTADMLIDSQFDSETRLLLQEVSLKARFAEGCRPLWLTHKMLSQPDLVFIVLSVDGLYFLIGDGGLPPVTFQAETRHAELTSANNGDWLTIGVKKERAVRTAYLF